MASIGVSRIMAVGGSMGAYGAMVFARDIGAASVLAFGPQYEVSLEGMADDPRWSEYRQKIPDHALGPVDPWLGDEVDYFALHGREGADIVHWTRFPVQENLHHYLMDHRWHDVPQWLKAEGKLRNCFELAMAGDRAGFQALMDEVGGQRRTADKTFETDPNDWLLSESPMAREGRLPPALQARADAMAKEAAQ